MHMQGSTQAPTGTTPHMGLARPVHPFARVLMAIWTPIHGIYRELRSRRAMEDMLELDPAVLRDMGVSRADIRRAINLPLRENAGADLASTSRRSSW